MAKANPAIAARNPNPALDSSQNEFISSITSREVSYNNDGQHPENPCPDTIKQLHRYDKERVGV
jgi:hypothetical protein